MASPDYVVRQRAEKQLAKDIRVRMAELDMDQKALARRLRMPETTISYWCNHPESLNLERWAKINSVLKLSPKSFLLAAGFGAI